PDPVLAADRSDLGLDRGALVPLTDDDQLQVGHPIPDPGHDPYQSTEVLDRGETADGDGEGGGGAADTRVSRVERRGRRVGPARDNRDVPTGEPELVDELVLCQLR